MQQGRLNWAWGGAALGLAFLRSLALVKPIGVSTQFVVVDGIVWNALADGLVTQGYESGYSSTNAYLAKSSGKYAQSVAQPLSYGLLFVLSMALGGFLSAKLKGPRPETQDRIAPAVWRNRFGVGAAARYAAVFAAGALTLFGARLAGGCTSGHMMSGMMQTSISGYLFAFAAFGAAIPVAIFVYGRK